jgi:hypothetical protein
VKDERTLVTQLVGRQASAAVTMGEKGRRDTKYRVEERAQDLRSIVACIDSPQLR